jgi:hypothetical protein
MPGMEGNPTAKEAWFSSPKRQNKIFFNDFFYLDGSGV